MPRLSKRQVDTIKIPGFYGDGEGLYLCVKPSGSKSWILRTMVQGRRRDIGLGSVAAVSLAEVRDRAREKRKIARAGGNPCRDGKKSDITFKDAATEYHRIISASFSSSKHAELWLSGLRNHAFPRIGEQKLNSIEFRDIREVLEPIWYTKPETAKRLKQRMKAIFEWSKLEGYYAGENPCTYITRVLKIARRNPVHHAALPWSEVPKFYAELSEMRCVSAFALRFIILTACRSKEVREAEWSEVKGQVWTLPEERAKARNIHRVPLSGEAMKVLAATQGLDSRFIFPSGYNRSRLRSQPLSVNAFRPLFRRMGRDGLTVHGFRSSFRDWCIEYAAAPREVAEQSLAHTLDQVERAYLRSDLLDQRTELMRNWGEFVSGHSLGN